MPVPHQRYREHQVHGSSRNVMLDIFFSRSLVITPCSFTCSLGRLCPNIARSATPYSIYLSSSGISLSLALAANPSHIARCCFRRAYSLIYVLSCSCVLSNEQAHLAKKEVSLPGIIARCGVERCARSLGTCACARGRQATLPCTT
mgnify:CR=1 FL=1